MAGKTYGWNWPRLRAKVRKLQRQRERAFASERGVSDPGPFRVTKGEWRAYKDEVAESHAQREAELFPGIPLMLRRNSGEWYVSWPRRWTD